MRAFDPDRLRLTLDFVVHGEAEAVLRVRRHLVRDRGLPPERLSATGDWKLRHTDEEWRASKREWMARAERDLAPAG